MNKEFSEANHKAGRRILLEDLKLALKENPQYWSMFNLQEKYDKGKECEHLNVLSTSNLFLGRCFCPDCNKHMFLYEVINSLFRAFQRRMITLEEFSTHLNYLDSIIS